MSFMNQNFGTEIKYANFSTNIHLELFLEKNGGDITEDNYRIEYYYNDDFLLSMKYTEFKNVVKSKLIKHDDVVKFCKKEEEDESEINWFMIGTIIASFIVIVLVIVIIVVLRKRVKENGNEVEDKDKLLRDTNRSSTENEQNNNENK